MSKRNHSEWFIVIALVLAFWLQMFLALPKFSATSDEVVHLPAGYTYWATRDFRMNREHPPLAKLISAAPLLLLKPRIDTTWPEWKTADEYTFGYGFLYTNDADRLLFWGRLAMTLVACIGAVTVFLWARDMFGFPSGLFALSLFAFSPNLLAHGMLVTTDVPLASFMTLALYLLWKHRSQRSTSNGFLLGLALGAALASKFSAVLLVPIVAGFTAWQVMRSEKPDAAGAAKHLTITGVAALMVVEASYFFQAAPWTYISDMRYVNANHNPIRLFYLFGDFSKTGWWYYFILAFLVKATIPLLLTLALAAVHSIARRFVNMDGEILILVTVVTYVAALILKADDLGVRYLLPVFPLLFVWSSRVVIELKRHRAGIVLALILLAWQARAALGAFPNYIPYFNEIAGGALRGVQYLDDSNVDWGQGMKQAGEYVRSHHFEVVELLPFSTFDNPRYYGVRRPQRSDLDTYQVMISKDRHPGVYIVSAHHLIRMMQIRPEWNPQNAIDRIGDSLWVYRF